MMASGIYIGPDKKLTRVRSRSAFTTMEVDGKQLTRAVNDGIPDRGDVFSGGTRGAVYEVLIDGLTPQEPLGSLIAPEQEDE